MLTTYICLKRASKGEQLHQQSYISITFATDLIDYVLTRHNDSMSKQINKHTNTADIL